MASADGDGAIAVGRPALLLNRGPRAPAYAVPLPDDRPGMLGEQRVVFVGGKGGVGKTTTSSALAVALAERGERCLVVSTDPAHSLGDLWSRPIGDRHAALAPGVWGLEVDPEAQVARHLERVRDSMREIVRPDLYPEIERQLSLARLSPGAVEAAMLERIADLMIAPDERFDRIVFDTAPTGHTLRLLSLPEIMAAWTDGLLRHRDRSDSWTAALKKLRPRAGVGDDLAFVDPAAPEEDERSARIRSVLLERRRKFYQARRMLVDRAATAFVLVLIPERLPILESRRAVATLGEYEVPIAAMVVNRVLPTGPLGDFLERRRVREAGYLEEIDRLFPRIPRIRLPLLPRDVEGIDALREMGRAILAG
jgi:arsenite/tail-anchored protein-transporting ATPase